MISDNHRTYWAAPPQRHSDLIADRWPSQEIATNMQKYTVRFVMDPNTVLDGSCMDAAPADAITYTHVSPKMPPAHPSDV